MKITFSEAVSGAPLRLFQGVTVLICLLVLVCDGIDMQLLGLVAPLIIDEWGIGRAAFGPPRSRAICARLAESPPPALSPNTTIRAGSTPSSSACSTSHSNAA